MINEEDAKGLAIIAGWLERDGLNEPAVMLRRLAEARAQATLSASKPAAPAQSGEAIYQVLDPIEGGWSDVLRSLYAATDGAFRRIVYATPQPSQPVEAGDVCQDCGDGECFVDGSENCALKSAVVLDDERAAFFDVVFDGPPSHKSGRFVEVEDEQGRSFNAGDWIDRGNGLWALRIARAASPEPAAQTERERQRQRQREYDWYSAGCTALGTEPWTFEQYCNFASGM